jgi:hypothetical protein
MGRTSENPPRSWSWLRRQPRSQHNWDVTGDRRKQARPWSSSHIRIPGR